MDELPVEVYNKIDTLEGGVVKITLTLTAKEEDIFFNISQMVNTYFDHSQAQFYMPGFWYRGNMRSPDSAPSLQSSDSWTVREDRLSAPLTSIYSPEQGRYVAIMRRDIFACDALSTHSQGEIILSGDSSIGHIGFENVNGQAALVFGFPYKESPYSYQRKRRLMPEVISYHKLNAGESITLHWDIIEGVASDFAQQLKRLWRYSYDSYSPQMIDSKYTVAQIKSSLSNYFVESIVRDYDLIYTSGIHLETNKCENRPFAEVGFIGRVLLNAFNALEYGVQTNQQQLINGSYDIFESYLNNGFTEGGLFREYVNYSKSDKLWPSIFSIRRQSEGIYAMFHFLEFETEGGRTHKEWEDKLRNILNLFINMQSSDGSFSRKFKDDLSIVDSSGGSTSCAILPLVMGYRYFKDKRYLESAERAASYIEREIIDKSDYFSSTLDANCEDKEAALYTSTAMYYLSLVTKGKKAAHYGNLCREAAYFTLSWYYLWDVPFAQGQMLGDMGFKSRGWGNVSVENNHIDVYIFEFASVLRWLSCNYDEYRFGEFADVISSSMSQLIPIEGNMCGIAKVGYNPEVVQHTMWDYGHNGKGYYNNLFAPAWAIASLWELYTPGRTEVFLNAQ
ncbi:MAG: hypothetical protein SNJ09_04650 [Rikenellaceae bacterium]